MGHVQTPLATQRRLVAEGAQPEGPVAEGAQPEGLEGPVELAVPQAPDQRIRNQRRDPKVRFDLSA
jgi:hypothetical protein